MANNKQAVWILSDIAGSDADDFQSAAYLLWYSDKLDIKGFTAGHPNGKRQGFISAINAYNKDRIKYKFPAEFPTGEYLKSVTYQDGPKAAAALVAESKKYTPKNPLLILVWGSAKDLMDAIKMGLNEKACICHLICSWNRTQHPAAHAFVKGRKQLRKILNETSFRGGYIPDPQPLNNKEMVLRLKTFGALGQWFYNKSAAITPKSYHIKNGDGATMFWALTHKNYDPTKPSHGGAFKRLDNTTWVDKTSHKLKVSYYNGARTVSRWSSKVRKDWLSRVKSLYQQGE